MSDQTQFLELYRGETLLGILSNIYLYDWPWYRCKFQTTPAFATYKPLFDHEWALQRDMDADATEEWEMAYAKIEELGLTLRYPSQAKATNIFLLHIHIGGDIAEFKVVFD